MAEVSKAIMVGVDGSPPSVKALKEARQFAQALHAPLRVITTWQVPVDVGAYVVVPDAGIDWENNARQSQTEALTAAFGDDVADIEGVVVEGNAAGVLVEESTNAQMLVVGSRGHGALASLLLGSVSSACVERAECSVLVVR